MIGLIDVGHKVRLLNGVVFIENPAAHHVEHGVRKVANVAAAISGQLQPVAGRNQRNESLRALFNVIQNVLLQGLHRFQVAPQPNHVADGFTQVRSHHPVLRCAGFQYEF